MFKNVSSLLFPHFLINLVSHITPFTIAGVIVILSAVLMAKVGVPQTKAMDGFSPNFQDMFTTKISRGVSCKNCCSLLSCSCLPQPAFLQITFWNLLLGLREKRSEGKAPWFLQTLSPTLNVHEGDPVELMCVVDGDPKPKGNFSLKSIISFINFNHYS